MDTTGQDQAILILDVKDQELHMLAAQAEVQVLEELADIQTGFAVMAVKV
jgi:hypothetical protein